MDRRRWGTALVVVFLPAALAAGARPDFADTHHAEPLLQLLAADPATAWAEADRLRARFEGDPAFDLVLARAALATGHRREALVALERVEFIAPETPGIRRLLLAARMDREAPAREADFAAPDEPDRGELGELADAVRSERFDAAFEQALALRDAWEGDPGFDYLYGMAALETGRHQEAVFALQRVLFFRPDQLQVRAHLARAHFLGGELDQAEREFNAVLAAGPPADVARSIRGYIAELSRLRTRQRPTLSGFLELAGGYDDNVNTASSLETIATPIGTFPLGDDGRAKSSAFGASRMQLAYAHPVSRRRSLDAVLAVALRRNHSADRFDMDVYRAEAGHNLTLEDHRLRAAIHVGHVRLDGDAFQWTGGLAGSWSTSVREWELQAGARFSLVRYPDAGSRDVDQFLLMLSATRAFDRDLIGLELLAGRDEARGGDHHGRDFASLAATWQHLWGGGHAPYLRLMVQGSRHHEDHPLFAARREDMLYSGSAGWSWFFSPELSARGELSYTRVDSTIELFDYERARLEAALRYRF